MSAWERIPPELRDRPQWVVWKREERDGKGTKVPYRPDGRGRASTTDASTWTTFEAAAATASKHHGIGIGYVFSPDDGFVGIDLDADLRESDRGAIMAALDSYAEFSPSGQGVHVIVKAALNGYGRNRRGPIEIYESGRYFTVTGEHVRGTPLTIEERQAQLDGVLAHFLPEPEPPAPGTREPQPVSLDDQELIERACAAKNGDVFRALWEGAWEDSYPSHSEADLGFCDRLAFWTGRDAGRIDRLYRASGLMREKWERRTDYRQGTIQKAIDGCRDTYSATSPTRSSEPASTPRPVAPVTDSQGESRPTGLPASPYRRPVGQAGSPTVTSSGLEAGPDRPFALAVDEFVGLEREDAEPLLADIDGKAIVAANSLTLIGATGGHGKTTFSLDLFLHLAAGVDYPPFTVPRPVDVLVIENEGPEAMFAAKLGHRLRSFTHELRGRLDVCVYDWGGFSLANDDHRVRLIEEIAGRGYDLIFGDPLDSLGIEGVGSPEDTRRFLELMKATGLHRSESGVAWWLNTHPRKAETREALDEIAGAWGGKPDTVLLLRRLDNDRTQIRFPKIRWARRGMRPTVLFAFDPESEAFAYIGEQVDDDRDYRAEILERLADGKWRTVEELSAKVENGGIAASKDVIRPILEAEPDVFAHRTKEAAKALGRSPNAHLYGLQSNVTDTESQDALDV